MGNKITNQDIEKYYDENQILYDIFWSQSALHAGFWEKNTRNLAEAITNTNRFILDCLDIKDNDTVLDAGCGVGGTSIYIAEQTGAQVTGITLSDTQLKKARAKSARSKASKLINFSKQDFTNTNFNNETFTKVFGIESICQAHDKLDFLKEAYRIMKPGGKICVIDAYLTRKNFNKKETEIYNKFINGWAVPSMSTKNDFFHDLGKAGFKRIKFYDKLELVKKSSTKIYHLGMFAYPITLPLSFLGIFPKSIHGNTISCINQKKMIDNNMATYGVIVADK